MDLILSDLHANLHALRAVLRYARRRAVQRFVLLGDLVGYGAHPNQVLDALRELRPKVMIRGNHDRACVAPAEDMSFSPPARMAASWTRERLSRENLHLLLELPEGPLAVGEDYVVAHGSPHDEDAYLLHPRDALAAFDAFRGHLCFFGHTHLPGYFELDEGRGTLQWTALDPGSWIDLRPNCRYLVNPGSVGQPRDRDARLSFLVHDPRRGRFKLIRLEYDHRSAGKAILKAGLHPHLAERLAFGM